MPAASTAALRRLEVGDVELDRVAADLAGDLAGALEVEVADPDLGALGGEPRGDRGADPAGAAGDQCLASPRASRLAAYGPAAEVRHAGEPRAYTRAAPDERSIEPIPIIGGTGALGSGLALRWARAGVRGRDRLAQRRARRGGRRAVCEARSRTPRSRACVNEEAAARGPIVFLTVPFRAQSENLNNLREALEPGQILVDCTVAARRRRQRQGDPHARRLAGLGRPAGAGDGPRGRHGRLGAAHGQRRRARRPRAPSSTRTC